MIILLRGRGLLSNGVELENVHNFSIFCSIVEISQVDIQRRHIEL